MKILTCLFPKSTSVPARVFAVAVLSVLHLFTHDAIAIAQAEASSQQRAIAPLSEETEIKLSEVLQMLNAVRDLSELGAVRLKLNDLKTFCAQTQCNPYELSQVFRVEAMFGVITRDMDLVIDANRRVLAQVPDIPLTTEVEALKMLAVVYLSRENYANAVDVLTRLTQHDTQMVSALAFAKAHLSFNTGEFMQALTQIHALISKATSNEFISIDAWSSLRADAYREAVKKHGLQKVVDDVFAGETDAIIISKPSPIYPQEAIDQSLEGYCTVSYTITKIGTTEKVKIDDCPNTIFREASIAAAKKFLYKPKYNNGKAVNDKRIKNRFTYKIAPG